jgi:16S rRNA (guanine527-N7)-methyltransferase
VPVPGLAKVLERFGAPESAAAALSAILELQATDPTASTTVTIPSAAVGRHVADSLVALRLACVRDARTVADLGSGAGWPGLALAAALPAAHVFLVESARRHCRYLERAVDTGRLANVDVVNTRVESWAAGMSRNDIVTARALAPLPVLVEYAAPLLVDGGRLVAWKASVAKAEADDAAAAGGVVGLELEEVHDVSSDLEARDRTLHVFRKVSATPARFPRRPGIAVKRPLAA